MTEYALNWAYFLLCGYLDEDGNVRVIRPYHRLFALEEITQLLNENNFKVGKVYKNLEGEALSEGSETYGIFARKA